MTLCPITKLEMSNPYVGTDHQSYEKYAISQWLDNHSRSPVTREPMQMHCVVPDYSMSRIIASMKEFAISDKVIANIEPLPSSNEEKCPTATIPSPEDIPTTSRETIEDERWFSVNEGLLQSIVICVVIFRTFLIIIFFIIIKTLHF